MPNQKPKVVEFYASKTERNKEIMRRFQEEVINKQQYDIEHLRQFVRDDIIDHGIPREGVVDCHAPFQDYTGIYGLQRRFQMFSSSFTDAEEADAVAIAEGDVVAMRYVLRGHLNGEFMGMKGNGEYFAMNGLEMIRFDEDGKMAEHWGVYDMLSTLLQLGFQIVPPSKKG
ncbi:MAG TPA: ester cyclase [Blastocatellia bacterium]|nr:ester cyclase [Blastocatellia bacterium]